MSEPKRVHLETIGGVGVAVKKSSSNSSNAADASSSSSSKTIRLDLKLFEPNVDSFPQFNYSTLLRVEKKKQKKFSRLNGVENNPFEENDSDVARMARELERKYGNAYAGSGARPMNNTPADRGSGYDENNGFIDDSEAYDELIPDEVEPDRGGFYINSGQLQFKQLSNFERPEDAERMPKPRKRVLSSSSSESNDAENENHPVDKNLKNGHHSEKRIKMINEKEKILNKDKKVDQIKLKEKADGGASDSGKETAKKETKTTTVKDMLRVQRDNMRNNSDSNGINTSGQTANTTTEDSSSSDDTSDSSDDEDDDDDDDDDEENNIDDEQNTEKAVPTKTDAVTSGDSEIRTEAGSQSNGIGGSAPNTIPKAVADTKLPENLNPTLLDKIKSIKEISKLSSSRSNFFDSNSLELLYEIDTLARSSGGSIRQQIYNHLEAHLPFTKQTLTNKVKKTRIEREEQKVQPLQLLLKKAIDEAMPAIISNYDAEFKRITELRAEANAIAASKGLEKPEQQIKNPRKKFQWTASIRSIFNEVIAKRKQAYAIIQPRNISSEEFIETYLREKIVPLWPSGWIKYQELLSEYRKDAKAKPKENKKINVGKTDNIRTQLTSEVASTMITEFKPNADTIVTANNNNVVKTKPHAMVNEVIANKMPIDKSAIKVTVNKTEKKLNDITSNVTGTSSLPSTYTSSMTITPTDGSNLIPKTLPSVTNMVTITTIASRPIDQPHINNKSSTITTTTTMKTKSINSSSNGNGNAINFNRPIDVGSSPEYGSPTKKASDHSICHIISSPSSNNSSTASPVKFPIASIILDDSPQRSHPHDNQISHIIVADSYKSKADFLLKGQQASNLKANKDAHLRIANNSVDSMELAGGSLTSKSMPTINVNNSSDSDVEFVGPVQGDRFPKAHKNAASMVNDEKKSKVNKHKHGKKNKQIGSAKLSTGINNSLANSNAFRPQASLLKVSQPLNAMARDPLAGDVDVIDANQIINDLKELSANFREGYESNLENNQSDSHYSQHHNSNNNNRRVSSPLYNRNQDHFF